MYSNHFGLLVGDCRNDDDESIPLGYVFDDTEILVVSGEASHICKNNEMGELWCREGTVTLGYLGLQKKV